MKQLGLGIIGLGNIGMVHLRSCTRIPNAKVVAVADKSKIALNEAKDQGVEKTFTDYKQLLKEDEVNSVIISLPTHLHAQCARDAAESHKHVFVEKPMARNIAEAETILSATQSNSVKLMVGYPLRFHREFANLKKQVNNGTLGDVEVAHATSVDSGPFRHRLKDNAPMPVPEWWFAKELTGGGVLMDLGSHMINLLRWYFGEIVEIKGLMGYRFNLGIEDSAICIAKFESGTKAVLTVGWFSQIFQQKIELLGTVRFGSFNNLPPKRSLAAIQMLTMNTSNFFQAYVAEIRHFVHCVLSDLNPSPSGIDGFRDVQAIQAAYENSI